MLRYFSSQKPELKSPREIGLMREAGKVVAEALRLCRSMAKPGTRTGEIDQAVAASPVEGNRYAGAALKSIDR